MRPQKGFCRASRERFCQMTLFTSQFHAIKRPSWPSGLENEFNKITTLVHLEILRIAEGCDMSEGYTVGLSKAAISKSALWIASPQSARNQSIITLKTFERILCYATCRVAAFQIMLCMSRSSRAEQQSLDSEVTVQVASCMSCLHLSFLKSASSLRWWWSSSTQMTSN